MREFKHLDTVVIIVYSDIPIGTYFRAKNHFFCKNSNRGFALKCFGYGLYQSFKNDDLVAILEKDFLNNKNIIDKFVVNNIKFKESS